MFTEEWHERAQPVGRGEAPVSEVRIPSMTPFKHSTLNPTPKPSTVNPKPWTRDHLRELQEADKQVIALPNQ